jgi:hypothetical protein
MKPLPGSGVSITRWRMAQRRNRFVRKMITPIVAGGSVISRHSWANSARLGNSAPTVRAAKAKKTERKRVV